MYMNENRVEMLYTLNTHFISFPLTPFGTIPCSMNFKITLYLKYIYYIYLGYFKRNISITLWHIKSELTT